MILNLILIGIIFLTIMNFSLETYNNFLPPTLSSPSTRNMSYDLRCEPEIPKSNDFPFYNTSIDHYRRTKCLS